MKGVANFTQIPWACYAQGKEAVPLNALNTGISATQIIIPGESPEEFEACAAALRNRYRRRPPPR
jgi:hypothetical protein